MERNHAVRRFWMFMVCGSHGWMPCARTLVPL